MKQSLKGFIAGFLVCSLFSAVVVCAAGEASKKVSNNPVLQESKLKDISDMLMDTYYSDFSSQRIPILPKDITSKNITYYFWLFLQGAAYEMGGSSLSKQHVKFNYDADEVVVSKKAIDEIASLFGKENVDLGDYLNEYYSSIYNSFTMSYTIKPANFSGYHNKETFDYTLNNIKISGNTAIVSYNTYYTEDFYKFMKYGLSGDFMKMPGWDFYVKVGVYKIYYSVINGNIVLDKTEYKAKPGFRFFTQ